MRYDELGRPLFIDQLQLHTGLAALRTKMAEQWYLDFFDAVMQWVGVNVFVVFLTCMCQVP